jgi:hypothetical protein
MRFSVATVEIWTGSQNTSVAGWVDPAGANVKRDLLIEAAFCGVEESHIRAFRLGPVGPCGCPGNASGSLATLDDGSTRLEQRRHLRERI